MDRQQHRALISSNSLVVKVVGAVAVGVAGATLGAFAVVGVGVGDGAVAATLAGEQLHHDGAGGVLGHVHAAALRDGRRRQGGDRNNRRSET
jgi:hypothetical protein